MFHLDRDKTIKFRIIGLPTINKLYWTSAISAMGEISGSRMVEGSASST